ncbi:MAG: hypothetical protein ACYC9L_06775 [Sulfuricaulis sp.]
MPVQDCVQLHEASACSGQVDSCHDPTPIIQLSLFGDSSRKLRRIPVRKKRTRGRGLQYRIKLHLRKTDRKIAFRTRFVDRDRGNDCTWCEEQAIALHSILLDESLETLKSHCERKSPRAAEIVAWIERKLPDEPFSFEACCHFYRRLNADDEVVGPLDPEELRNLVRNLIRTTFRATLPHAKVLRKGIEEAEAGNQEAIEWVLSDVAAPLSFSACCDALGFDVELARQEIVLPNPIDDDVDDVVQRAIDSVFGPPPAAIAA